MVLSYDPLKSTLESLLYRTQFTLCLSVPYTMWA